jgi:hypothetical protein
LEFDGVRIEIDLLFEIRLVEFAHIMVNEGNGDNQRDIQIPDTQIVPIED